MKLLYFAGIRDGVGFASEEREVPPDVVTVSALISLLCAEGDHYARAFSDMCTVRVAIDRVHADLDASLAGVREIAFFPPMTGG